MRVLKLFDVDIADLLHGESAPIHGCETDTSLLLFLAPDPIRWKLAHDYTMATCERRRYRKGGLKVAADGHGSVGQASLAPPEKGRLRYQRIHKRVRERVCVSGGMTRFATSPASDVYYSA